VSASTTSSVTVAMVHQTLLRHGCTLGTQTSHEFTWICTKAGRGAIVLKVRCPTFGYKRVKFAGVHLLRLRTPAGVARREVAGCIDVLVPIWAKRQRTTGTGSRRQSIGQIRCSASVRYWLLEPLEQSRITMDLDYLVDVHHGWFLAAVVGRAPALETRLSCWSLGHVS
jgi:hypothetical protein